MDGIKRETEKDCELNFINNADISIISIKYPYLNIDQKEDYTIDNVSNG